jgi:hypothetical protein
MSSDILKSLVSKRYFVTLPDGIAAALEKWAELERNKPTSLAAFLIEKEVREAARDGVIPPIAQIQDDEDSKAEEA